MNPWVIIRWAFVAALFAGTVAIAVDQVRTRDKALVAAYAKIDKLKNGLAGVSQGLGKVADSNTDLMEATAQMQSGLSMVQSGMVAQAENSKVLADLSEHTALMVEWTQMEKEAKVIIERLKAAETARLNAKTPEERDVATLMGIMAETTAHTERMKVNAARRKALTAAGR